MLVDDRSITAAPSSSSRPSTRVLDAIDADKLVSETTSSS
jgi:hypothetical protein